MGDFHECSKDERNIVISRKTIINLPEGNCGRKHNGFHILNPRTFEYLITKYNVGQKGIYIDVFKDPEIKDTIWDYLGKSNLISEVLKAQNILSCGQREIWLWRKINDAMLQDLKMEKEKPQAKECEHPLQVGKGKEVLLLEFQKRLEPC